MLKITGTNSSYYCRGKLVTAVVQTNDKAHGKQPASFEIFFTTVSRFQSECLTLTGADSLWLLGRIILESLRHETVLLLLKE